MGLQNTRALWGSRWSTKARSMRHSTSEKWSRARGASPALSCDPWALIRFVSTRVLSALLSMEEDRRTASPPAPGSRSRKLAGHCTAARLPRGEGAWEHQDMRCPARRACGSRRLHAQAVLGARAFPRGRPTETGRHRRHRHSTRRPTRRPFTTGRLSSSGDCGCEAATVG
jgi:hypothetical protein